jgi:hypothetical protein
MLSSSQYLWAQQRRWFRYKAASNHILCSACVSLKSSTLFLQVLVVGFPSGNFSAFTHKKSCSLKKDSF